MMLRVHTALVCFFTAACAPPVQERADAGTAASASSRGETVLQALPSPVRIAVLGDRTGHPDDGMFRAVLEEIRRLAPDVVISVGDFIDGYQPDGRIPEAEAEWDSVLEAIRRKLGDVPIFSAAGNHDVWSPASEALFTARLNPPNVSMRFGSTAVIFFDTSRVDSETDLSDEALDWLVSALYEARDAEARVVVTHKPLFALPGGGSYGAPLHDVLIAGNADLVICGHWHHAMADDRDGIQYRMIGTSGAMPNRPEHPESGNLTQFAWLVADTDGIRFSIVKSGAVVPSDAFPYAMNQLEWKIERYAVIATGFEMDPKQPSATGRLDLTVANVTDVPLKSRLDFDSGDWRVIPSAYDVDLAPGATRRLRPSFARKSDVPLFPGPAFSMVFPFFEETYRLQSHLTPTLWIQIKRSKTPWMLDGVLSDEERRAATPTGPFMEERGAAPPSADVRVMVRNDFLYIAATVDAPGANCEETDQDSYLEDRDHLLVLADGNIDTPEYARFVIDCAGRISQRRVQSAVPRRPADVQAVAKRTDRGWTAEIVIPLGELEPAPARRTVGFNIAAAKARPDTYGKSFWQPHLEHDVEALGRLSF